MIDDATVGPDPQAIEEMPEQMQADGPTAAELRAALAQAHRDLHHLRSTYGALVEQIPAIVYQDVTDENWTTVYVSPQLTKLLGVSPDEWIGDSQLWSEMIHDDDRDRAIEEVDRGIASGEPYTVEYRMIGRDGRVRWFQDTAVMIPDAEGNPAFTHGVMLDVTDRREAEEQLTYLAYHDRLTGMPNRAMFDELLELSLARARRAERGVAVLALDLDNFKLVNDSLGLEAGDRLIVQVALRLQEATRDTDLVARSGGDEFFMLLADLDQTTAVAGENGAAISAEAVAHRVLESFEAPFEVDGTELYLTASIGISVFPLDADDAVSVLRNADSAVYRAKAAGPGSYVINQIENERAISKLSLSTRLRKAVEHQDWTLHYQPLIDLFSGDMFGVEALIRWPDPSGGLVPPGDFIPLAEEMGLIEAIGAWVVAEICRQDAVWRAEGLELEISFNLSPRQLWQPDPVDSYRPPDRGGGDRSAAHHGRDHRVDRDERPRPHAPGAPRLQGPRAQARDRRLRHRLLVALAASLHAGRRPQDRPPVRSRRQQRSAEREHGLGDHRPGLEPADGAARRGHRDRGGVAVPRGARVRGRPGLPVLAAGAAGGDLGEPPPARSHRRRRRARRLDGSSAAAASGPAHDRGGPSGRR